MADGRPTAALAQPCSAHLAMTSSAFPSSARRRPNPAPGVARPSTDAALAALAATAIAGRGRAALGGPRSQQPAHAASSQCLMRRCASSTISVAVRIDRVATVTASWATALHGRDCRRAVVLERG